ncbi:hypothetical protein N9J52_02760 [Flavobacteriales bacterium]|nr:hypothetical protein [Flavobacteriales bacterium]
MSSIKPSLFWLFAIAIILVPTTGCEDDREPRMEASPEVTSPSHVAEWLEQLRAIIRFTDTSGAQASRILAYSSIAYYEGYALGFDDMRSLVGQLEGLNALPSPNPNQTYNYGVIAESAITTCLLRLYEDAPQSVKLAISSTYSDHEREYIKLGVAESVISRSRALGDVIGEAIKVWMDGDGYAELGNCSVTVPAEPGNWRPTPGTPSEPEFPCWGDLRPFTFNESQLTALCNPGFPAEVSSQAGSAYNDDINELISISQNLSATDEETALFWEDKDGGITVPGHYTSVLEQLVDQNLLNGNETVTAWAQLCIAMADTYISTYKLKYTYFRPRPLTVIQESNNPNWESVLINPATPEYPSTRLTIAYSATQVFINLYGNIAFTDATYSNTGLSERPYSSFNEMAEDVVQSRLNAGTNLRTTLENSDYHGRCIAQRANELFFNQ